MKKYKYITIIPARGGSKRFPDKNIYHLDNKPLIAHSIEYAFRCEKISHIYVTSDSESILDIASKYLATPLKRPDELSGDYISTAAVLEFVAKDLQEQGMDFDYVVLLQPTNPLRPANLLSDAISLIDSNHYDSLMSVSVSNKKLGKIINNQFIPWNYYLGQRSQDMEPLYYENGLLYISKKELLLQGRIIGDNMYPLVVSHIFGEIDIDTIEDMRYAEYLISRQNAE
ncbi:MAG: acylneuraminate cytidylyltransferase family protein [Bacteroidales bacterium]